MTIYLLQYMKKYAVIVAERFYFLSNNILCILSRIYGWFKLLHWCSR